MTKSSPTGSKTTINKKLSKAVSEAISVKAEAEFNWNPILSNFRDKMLLLQYKLLGIFVDRDTTVETMQEIIKSDIEQALIEMGRQLQGQKDNS